MARRGRAQAVVALALLFFLLWAGPAQAKAAKKTKAPHNRDDVKYIKCGVCQEVAKVLARDVKQMKSEKKVKEIDILDRVEKVCDPDTPPGSWITHIDLKEDGSKLKLVTHEEVGACGEECRTVAKACEDIIGYHDTDLAETFFSTDLSRAALDKLLCRELTDSCTKPTPPLPAGRKPGPAFTLKSEKERYLDELTGQMGDMPGKMSLYSRDDIEEEFMRGPGGRGDEDEDDEDEDEMFSSAYQADHGFPKPKAKKAKEVGAWEAVAGFAADALSGVKQAALGALDWAHGALRSAAGSAAKPGGGAAAAGKKGKSAGGGGGGAAKKPATKSAGSSSSSKKKKTGVASEL